VKILADTSIWVDHLRRGNPQMSEFLTAGHIVVHDHVVGELCLGGLSREKLSMMQLLHRCVAASHDEVMHLIGQRRLTGRGLGYVDTHLLAAALIGRLRLWTLDQALQKAAGDCGCSLTVH
jgi:predicted nucleic acid-binding protein